MGPDHDLRFDVAVCTVLHSFRNVLSIASRFIVGRLGRSSLTVSLSWEICPALNFIMKRSGENEFTEQGCR